MKSARTKACEIPKKVKEKVYERDGGLCIISGKPGIPNAHYIPRSLGGLGIEQNVVTLAPEIHDVYDNGSWQDGNARKEIGARIKAYLDKHYPGFRDYDRIYHK
jgi:5-methylcytosine-specific restriction endonuclease McrA